MTGICPRQNWSINNFFKIGTHAGHEFSTKFHTKCIWYFNIFLYIIILNNRFYQIVIFDYWNSGGIFEIKTRFLHLNLIQVDDICHIFLYVTLILQLSLSLIFSGNSTPLKTTLRSFSSNLFTPQTRLLIEMQQ